MNPPLGNAGGYPPIAYLRACERLEMGLCPELTFWHGSLLPLLPYFFLIVTTELAPNRAALLELSSCCLCGPSREYVLISRLGFEI